MSETENVPQDQNSEEELSDATSTSPDPSDVGGADEGDPPIIIQGGGSGNPG